MQNHIYVHIYGIISMCVYMYKFMSLYVYNPAVTKSKLSLNPLTGGAIVAKVGTRPFAHGKYIKSCVGQMAIGELQVNSVCFYISITSAYIYIYIYVCVYLRNVYIIHIIVQLKFSFWVTSRESSVHRKMLTR